MKNARYIIRLDDSCPTQHRIKWAKLENILYKLDIKPIVAIVPDNKDKKLYIDKIDEDYWSKVNAWQDSGWTIALHGCHHVYQKIDKFKSLIPLYDRSEFTGKSLKEQSKLIAHGYKILKEQGIKPTVWIAPSHTFDENTVKALLKETDIRIISDGFFLWPKEFHQMTIIPQQLWAPTLKKSGIWTICLHPNQMSYEDIEKLEGVLSNGYEFISVDDALKLKRTDSILSRIWRYYQLSRWQIRQFLTD